MGRQSEGDPFKDQIKPCKPPQRSICKPNPCQIPLTSIVTIGGRTSLPDRDDLDCDGPAPGSGGNICNLAAIPIE
jgi:hypothetical protein